MIGRPFAGKMLAFLFGAFAAGFFGAPGGDLYEALKLLISDHYTNEGSLLGSLMRNIIDYPFVFLMFLYMVVSTLCVFFIIFINSFFEKDQSSYFQDTGLLFFSYVAFPDAFGHVVNSSLPIGVFALPVLIVVLFFQWLMIFRYWPRRQEKAS